MNRSIKVHRQIELLLALNVEVDEIFDSFSPAYGYYALPAEQAALVISKQQSCGQLYVLLKEHFQDEEVPLFNVVSKLHLSLRSCLISSSLHPHLAWCWKGEDFMGAASRLLGSCVRGRNDIAASIKAADKYRLAMHMSWSAVCAEV